MPRPTRPSARYLQLMNGRYNQLVAAGHPPLNLSYDGATWTARLAVPAGSRSRWVSGEGVTLDAAVEALARELGVELRE